MPYPRWSYYPRNVRCPGWVTQLVEVVADAESDITTEPARATLKSDEVLATIRPGLTGVGYAVESGKSAANKIRRPVLFGDNGAPEVSYELDAFHDDLGIAVEVEAARGAQGNATFRDLVRASLILDAQYFALLVPIAYRYQSGRRITVKAYDDARGLLHAIYASQRLRLPFDGVLLIGY